MSGSGDAPPLPKQKKARHLASFIIKISVLHCLYDSLTKV